MARESSVRKPAALRSLVRLGSLLQGASYHTASDCLRFWSCSICWSRREVASGTPDSAYELLSIGVEKHQAAFSSGTWLTGTPLTYLGAATIGPASGSTPRSSRSRHGWCCGSCGGAPAVWRRWAAASKTRQGFRDIGPDPCNNALLVELRPILHIHLYPQTSKRFHLRFHLGRADHSERVK